MQIKNCVSMPATACASPLRYKRVNFKRKGCKFATMVSLVSGFLGLITLPTKLPTADVQSEWKLTLKRSNFHFFHIPSEVKKREHFTRKVCKLATLVAVNIFRSFTGLIFLIQGQFRFLKIRVITLSINN